MPDEIVSLAAAILAGARYNEADVLRLAGSVLSAAPDAIRSADVPATPTSRSLFGVADGEVAKDQVEVVPQEATLLEQAQALFGAKDG